MGRIEGMQSRMNQHTKATLMGILWGLLASLAIIGFAWMEGLFEFIWY